MADALYFEFHRVAVQGDGHTITIYFKDSDGDPVDVSDKTFFYTAKSDLTVDDDAAEIAIDHADFTIENGNGTDDKVTFTLPAASTALMPAGQYHHDIQWLDGTTPITIGVGYLVIVAQVTKRVASLP